MDEKFQFFNGLKFTRDDTTGYYLNSTIRKRMHRYVWEFYKGEIPSGYEIHHIDKNKANNTIENLECLTIQEHKNEHRENSKELGAKNIESGHLNRIRELASEWHDSEEGRKWHKKHYEKMKHKLHQKDKFICLNCNDEFISTITGNNKFCSNKCKSAWRRKSGVDDVDRECEICKKAFRANKYSKIKTCSRECGAILRKKNSSI